MVQPELRLKGGRQGLNFDWEELFFKYRIPLSLFLVGFILLGLGVFLTRDSSNGTSEKIEILESASESQKTGFQIVVEVSGAVENPGVYKLSSGVRVEEALIAAGGISSNADRDWMEKGLNRAAKISDGQKIYIPRVGEPPDVAGDKNFGGYQGDTLDWGSGVNNLINVNMASAKELESLWGIGPVTAQNIIEQRPYSSVEELLTKKILKKNVYERNKDKLIVY